MGSQISGLMDGASNDAKEKLSALEKMAKAQLDANKTRILSGSTIDQELRTGTVVSRIQRVYVSAQSDATKVKESIGDFFNGEVIDGIQKLVNVAVDAILGNTAVGETETEQMLILWENDALVRFDLYYWKWSFSNSGIVDVAENVLAVFCLKRVIDIKTVKFSVLVYAIEGMLKREEGEDVSDIFAIQQVQGILKRLYDTRKAVNADEFESKDDPDPQPSKEPAE